MTAGTIATWIIVAYLVVLLGLGFWSSRSFRGTAVDYFLASHGLGSMLLLLSIFGTTMTAFAMQGSSGEAWKSGIAVYGKMASWSGIVHSACFFLIGTKLWALGKRYGYQTQVQFFRDRLGSSHIGLLLAPILCVLVMVYVLMGVIGTGNVIQTVTEGTFPKLFAATKGGVPYSLATAIVCGVVLMYVLLAGVRGTAWANAFQTLVFLIVGIVTFAVIAQRLGGLESATRLVQEYNPTKLTRGVTDEHMRQYEAQLAKFQADPRTAVIKPHKPEPVPQLEFLSYGLIPLSVAMFPHLFQLWLTARTAKKFRLTVVAHPILIMLVWMPCVLIGVWATSAVVDGHAVIPPDFRNPNDVLSRMVKELAHPALGGLLAAGILAAIIGGLDAQFLSIGSILTHDLVNHYRREPMTDTQLLRVGRIFVTVVVILTYAVAVLVTQKKAIFQLGVWCFSGFAALFPLVFAALYWRRLTKAGAYASVLAAGGAWFWLFRASHYGADAETPIWGMLPVIPIFAAATVALILVSLVTRPPAQAVVSRFFPEQADAG